MAGNTNSGRDYIDEIGNHYGRLTVIKRGKTDQNGAGCWICECECGGSHEVAGSYLRCGDVRSCGCLRPKLLGDEASFRSLLYQYKRASKRRGHKWDLSMEEFRNLTKQNCYYCGTEPHQYMCKRENDTPYYYNGIDRIDNSRGYVLENVVSCCGVCNKAKGTMSQDDFLEWVDRLYEHLTILRK